MQVLSALYSVGADAGDQKEGKFVMNGPLSELAADQSIPMSRSSALPVVGNLPITDAQSSIHMYSSVIGHGSI